MNKHRLLLINHSLHRSGAPAVLLCFAKWLTANTNCSVEVISLSDGDLASEFAEVAPHQIISPRAAHPSKIGWLRRLLNTRTVYSEECLVARLNSEPFDLIYSNTITNGHFLERFAIKAPVITHVHELEYWIQKAGTANLKAVKATTTRYIAAAHFVKNNLVNRHEIDSRNIDVIHEFIPGPLVRSTSGESTELRKMLGINRDDFVLCASGQEFWRKGRDLVPHLLYELKKLVPHRSVHLIWVGQPGTLYEESALQFDLERLGLLDRFHLTGSTPNPERYFSLADVFVLTSRDDPFPLVCLENASFGVPIVCFADAGGMPEFIGNNECGDVVPYLDVPAMSQAISRLLLDRELRTRKGEAAKVNLEKNYLANVACPKIFQIIERTIVDFQRRES